MHTLYTKWVADAVKDLYENHKLLILDAFEKTGVCIDMNGFDKGKIVVPNFHTYDPPEKSEVFRNTPYTEAEIKAMEKEEKEARKRAKAEKKRKRKVDQIERNIKRAKNM